jgi:hypothetical protein
MWLLDIEGEPAASGTMPLEHLKKVVEFNFPGLTEEEEIEFDEPLYELEWEEWAIRIQNLNPPEKPKKAAKEAAKKAATPPSKEETK